MLKAKSHCLKFLSAVLLHFVYLIAFSIWPKLPFSLNAFPPRCISGKELSASPLQDSRGLRDQSNVYSIHIRKGSSKGVGSREMSGSSLLVSLWVLLLDGVPPEELPATRRYAEPVAEA